MLYKVTPMMTPPVKVKPARDPNAPKEPRKRRKSAVYDADGNEVLITMMCLKCRSMKPLAMFGLRKMADGAIRNQPWCRTCRSGASSGKKRQKAQQPEAVVETAAQALPPPIAASVSLPLAAPPLPAAEALADTHDAEDAADAVEDVEVAPAEALEPAPA